MGLKKQQRRHAKQRAFQRYGVRLNSTDLRRLNAKIRCSRDVEQIRVKNSVITEYLIHFEGMIYRVYYSSKTNQIVTFVPLTRNAVKLPV